MKNFDKYDIIDFLEYDYIDYLKSIETDRYKQIKKDLDKEILLLEDVRIIDFILTKINTDISSLIVKEIGKVKFKIFKFYFEKDKKSFYKNIKKNTKFFKEIINNQDLEFNKYIVEQQIFEIINNNKKNIYGTMSPFKKEINDAIIHIYFHNIKYYEVLKYYVNLFGYITEDFSFTKKKKIFEFIIIKNKIDNIEKVKDILNLLKISKNDFEKYILITKDNKNQHNSFLIEHICINGNLELFIEIINNYNIKLNILDKEYICLLLCYTCLSKNSDFIIVFLNYLKMNNIHLDNYHYTTILHKLMLRTQTKDYNDIILNLINLGASAMHSSKYKEYYQSIKIKK